MNMERNVNRFESCLLQHNASTTTTWTAKITLQKKKRSATLNMGWRSPLHPCAAPLALALAAELLVSVNAARQS